ncbi:MAG TPA: SAM-dependent methyltransferase [Acidimicrobiales bacterium]
MAERSSTRPETAREPIEIDTGTAHTSRMYDYLLGGTDNFAVDRETAHHAFAAYPGGFEAARADARSNRAFIGRVVRYLAGEAGIRQFLDIGTGIPGPDNVHAVVKQVAPDSKVVYVDNDLIVLAHAHALLKGEPDTRYVDADLRDPAGVLAAAGETLDFSKPVAVLLIGILHVIPDSAQPHRVVSELLDAVPSGSYLGATHLLRDVESEQMAELFARLEATTSTTNPPAFRTRDEFARFFDGLELVEPGLVEVNAWRPDANTPAASGRAVPLYSAVGRKP